MSASNKNPNNPKLSAAYGNGSRATNIEDSYTKQNSARSRQTVLDILESNLVRPHIHPTKQMSERQNPFNLDQEMAKSREFALECLRSENSISCDAPHQSQNTLLRDQPNITRTQKHAARKVDLNRSYDYQSQPIDLENLNLNLNKERDAYTYRYNLPSPKLRASSCPTPVKQTSQYSFHRLPKLSPRPRQHDSPNISPSRSFSALCSRFAKAIPARSCNIRPNYTQYKAKRDTSPLKNRIQSPRQQSHHNPHELCNEIEKPQKHQYQDTNANYSIHPANKNNRSILRGTERSVAGGGRDSPEQKYRIPRTFYPNNLSPRTQQQRQQHQIYEDFDDDVKYCTSSPRRRRPPTHHIKNDNIYDSSLIVIESDECVIPTIKIEDDDSIEFINECSNYNDDMQVMGMELVPHRGFHMNDTDDDYMRTQQNQLDIVLKNAATNTTSLQDLCLRAAPENSNTNEECPKKSKNYIPQFCKTEGQKSLEQVNMNCRERGCDLMGCDFQTLFGNNSRPDETASARACARASRCGLIRFDDMEKYEALDPRRSSIQKTEVENLVQDAYCPGIIQDTIDGRENFNKHALNISVSHEVKDINSRRRKPLDDPMTLLEAFSMRIDRDRAQIKKTLKENATQQQIEDKIHEYFAAQNPTDLNRCIKSLLISERLQDLEQADTSKGRSLEAEVFKFFTNFPNKPDQKIEAYCGQTNPIKEKAALGAQN